VVTPDAGAESSVKVCGSYHAACVGPGYLLSVVRHRVDLAIPKFLGGEQR